jgi:hypothetical protein
MMNPNDELFRRLTQLERRLQELERSKPEVGAWAAAVPTVTQSGSVTFSATHAEAFVTGKLVTYNAFLAITGAGTITNNIVITVPAAIQPFRTGNIGTGYIFDTSAGGIYWGALVAVGAADIRLRLHSLTTITYMGVNPNFALASGDAILIEGAWRIS